MNAKIKIFTGDTLTEARAKVDREFGKDALIYDIKTIKTGGVLGFFSRTMVQIIARKDEESQTVDVPQVKKTPPETIDGKTKNYLPPLSPNSDMLQVMELQKQILEIRERVVKMESEHETKPESLLIYTESESPPVHETLQPVYDSLVSQGLCKDYVANFVTDIEKEVSIDILETGDAKDDFELRNILEAKLGSLINVGPRLEDPEKSGQKIVAFVGPTGVGKTTTLVKLAGDLSIRDGRSVGVITFDTFRIGAPEQLEQYCKIMYLPCQVVYTPGELMIAIEKFKDKEFIFIDSAGRSHKNRSDMKEAKRFLPANLGIEPYLVISATTKFEDMMEICKRFKAVFYKNLIVTKLDETNTIGPVYRLLRESKLPISYFTTGQSVPGDIEYADASKFIRRLIKTTGRATNKARRKKRQQSERQTIKQVIAKKDKSEPAKILKQDSLEREQEHQ